MCFIGFKVEQEMSAPPPKKYPGSAPGKGLLEHTVDNEVSTLVTLTFYENPLIGQQKQASV